MATFSNNMNIPNQPIVPRAYPTGNNCFQFLTQWTMRHDWMSSGMHISDPSGNTFYRAVSKIWSWSWDLDLFDAQRGTLLGNIKQELRLGLPKFTIVLNGTEFATIKMDLALFRPSFTIQSCNGPIISVEGDWLGHSYKFKRGEHIIATVSKSWAMFIGTYTVDIVPGENVLFILSCCIVIVKCSQRRRRARR